MLLKYIWIGAIGFLLLSFSFFAFVKWMYDSNPDYVIKKLKDEEVKSSMVFREQDEVMIDLHSSELMPLASTVKIIVAMEYAYQVSEETLDGKENINLKELERYYTPKLDGGAHEAWLEYVKEKGIMENETVPLREVARGMMAFSSNANTEYLMERLGIEQIETRMKKVGITDHTPLFYFVSALFIPYELKNPGASMKDAEKDILSRMKNMNEDEWINLTMTIHEKLSMDDEYQVKASIHDWWNADYDQLFSEKFTKSTTFEYGNLMSKINNKMFEEDVQEELEYLLGSLMENPANQEWLERAGKKGGSTRYILTDALFAEDKQGNRFELAIFFHELGMIESNKLMSSLNEFELKLLSDTSFREKVYQSLGVVVDE